jgi:hypothetical protein
VAASLTHRSWYRKFLGDSFPGIVAQYRKFHGRLLLILIDIGSTEGTAMTVRVTTETTSGTATLEELAAANERARNELGPRSARALNAQNTGDAQCRARHTDPETIARVDANAQAE